MGMLTVLGDGIEVLGRGLLDSRLRRGFERGWRRSRGVGGGGWRVGRCFVFGGGVEVRGGAGLGGEEGVVDVAGTATATVTAMASVVKKRLGNPSAVLFVEETYAESAPDTSAPAYMLHSNLSVLDDSDLGSEGNGTVLVL